MKAGGWYIIANFVNKALAMLLTPFLARMMTTNEFGEFSNFAAWASILSIITTLDMANVIVRAKFDYEKEFDTYMSSIVIATFVSTGLTFLVIWVLKDYFSGIFGFDGKYIYALFLYLLFQPAIDYYIARQTALLNYRAVALLPLTYSLLTLVCSILFVKFMSDRLWGRTLGYISIPILYGAAIYLAILKKKRKADFSIIKYTLHLSIPLIPHNMSNGILGSSDRILIKRLCAAGFVAYYSVAYNVGNILYIFTQSVSQAFTPWLYSKMNKEEYTLIPKINDLLSIASLVLISLFIGLAPEIVYILGGEDYFPAVKLVPVITVGVYFQFISKLYINIEHYLKKTYIISSASLLAATSNFCLNIVLLPQYGYMAAAWTTLISYILSVILHLRVVRKTQYRSLINNRYQLMLSCVSLLLIPLSKILYVNLLARSIYLMMVMIGGLYLFVRMRDRVFITSVIKH